ncbi:MAG: hypothetical protein ACRDP1_02470 [Nocardioidaceae bacterium]
MRPPQASRVAEVVDALLALAASALPDLQVIDGPAAGSAVLVDEDVLQVAGGSPAVLVDQVREPGLSRGRVETARVMCVLSCIAGMTETKTVRDRCKAALDALAQALRDDGTLGGVVDAATLGQTMEWHTLQSDGAVCEVLFEVTTVAHI